MRWILGILRRNTPKKHESAGTFSANQLACIADTVKRNQELKNNSSKRDVKSELKKEQDEKRAQIESLVMQCISLIDAKAHNAARLGHNATSITAIIEERLSFREFSLISNWNKSPEKREYIMRLSAEILNSYYSKRGFIVKHQYYLVTKYGLRTGLGNHGYEATGYYKDRENGIEISW